MRQQHMRLPVPAGGQDGHMAASAPRTCVQLGANAAAELVEDFGPSLGGSATFTNPVLEVQPPAAGTCSRLQNDTRALCFFRD
jgi:hypothetical protein